MFSSVILRQPRPPCAWKCFQDVWRSSRPPCPAHVTEPGRSTPPSSFTRPVVFPRAAADPGSVTRGDPEMITPDEPWMRGNPTTVPWELRGQARRADTRLRPLRLHSQGASRWRRRGAKRNGSQRRCIIDEIHCDVSPGGRSKAK